MPNLRNLSVISADFSYAGDGFREFFEAHGDKIVELELGHSTEDIEDHYAGAPSPFSSILQGHSLAAWCPNLKKFVCSAEAVWNWYDPDWIAPHVLLPAHPGVEVIGVRGLERRLREGVERCERRDHSRLSRALDSELAAQEKERRGRSDGIVGVEIRTEDGRERREEGDEHFFMLLEQFESLLNREAFPSLRYVKDLSWESGVMRKGCGGTDTGCVSSSLVAGSGSHAQAESSLSGVRGFFRDVLRPLSPKHSPSPSLSAREVREAELSRRLKVQQHRRVLRFWMRVLEKCKARGVWLEDWEGWNITPGEVRRMALGGEREGSESATSVSPILSVVRVLPVLRLSGSCKVAMDMWSIPNRRVDMWVRVLLNTIVRHRKCHQGSVQYDIDPMAYHAYPMLPLSNLCCARLDGGEFEESVPYSPDYGDRRSGHPNRESPISDMTRDDVPSPLTTTIPSHTPHSTAFALNVAIEDAHVAVSDFGSTRNTVSEDARAKEVMDSDYGWSTPQRFLNNIPRPQYLFVPRHRSPQPQTAMAPIRTQPTHPRLSSTQSILEIGSLSPEPEIMLLDALPTPRPLPVPKRTKKKINAEATLASPPLSPRVEAGPSTNGVDKGKGRTKSKSKPVAKKTIPIPMKGIELGDSSDAEVVEGRNEVNGLSTLTTTANMETRRIRGRGRDDCPHSSSSTATKTTTNLYLPSTPILHPQMVRALQPFLRFGIRSSLRRPSRQPHAQRSPSPQPHQPSPSTLSRRRSDPPPPRPIPMQVPITAEGNEAYRLSNSPFDLDAVSGSQGSSGSSVKDNGKGEERREITQTPAFAEPNFNSTFISPFPLSTLMPIHNPRQTLPDTPTPSAPSRSTRGGMTSTSSTMTS
ncbi:hypothetical protein NMY22_g19127 [Coprinellus aureogranulatus]|nr:hypothetical protein NMY22_g19127 [Coprinellus aureogranulatus]